MMNLINESLETGYFPDEWKMTTVHPIPKIGKTIKAEEHRPINTMPIDEKIIETIVKNELIKYIERCKLLYKNQSAFRKNHLCETTMNYLLHNINMSLDNDEFTVIVFLDLKRAFETVDRNLLLKKLESFGIKGNELDWFGSYLKNRRQRTKYKNTMSDEIDVPIGIPQGTPLNVLLFMLY